MAHSTQAQPFLADRYDLGALQRPKLVPLSLRRFREGEAAHLGALAAAMDPWARLRVEPDHLARAFGRAPGADGTQCLAIVAGETLAGGVVVKPSWLIGPYLNILVILPQFQGQGAGRAVLTWFEGEARLQKARNMWVCVAAFNVNARRLYERHGFVLVTEFADLITEGEGECLLRKRL